MDNKKIIIIGILLLIVVGIVVVMFSGSSNYEKVNITPNGTKMYVPVEQTQYYGEYEGVKLWGWDNGLVVTYNNNEGKGIIQLIGLSFNTLNELVKAGDVENVDGFTCYTIDADELLNFNISDIAEVKYEGKLYCIPLSNANTQDNILIFCNDKNTALDMAKSVEYKNVYPEGVNLNEVASTVENLSNGIQSFFK